MSERDKVVLKVGAVMAVLILFTYKVFLPAIGSWNNIKEYNKSHQAIMENLGLSDSVQAERELRRLVETVPTFAMPVNEDQQRQIFLEEFYKQIRSCNLKVTSPPQFQAQVRSHPDKTLGLNVLRLKCRGTCRFRDAMNLLAKLYENPYLYSVEEMHLVCGDKNRDQIDLTLVVTTLCQTRGIGS
ncbi:MAG: hypothetical protein GY869_23435 [Planctomycetes bacterium]|nr:hypothetical protein [Planctomycetota bacterium]